MFSNPEELAQKAKAMQQGGKEPAAESKPSAEETPGARSKGCKQEAREADQAGRCLSLSVSLSCNGSMLENQHNCGLFAASRYTALTFLLAIV